MFYALYLFIMVSLVVILVLLMRIRAELPEFCIGGFMFKMKVFFILSTVFYASRSLFYIANSWPGSMDNSVIIMAEPIVVVASEIGTFSMVIWFTTFDRSGSPPCELSCIARCSGRPISLNGCSSFEIPSRISFLENEDIVDNFRKKPSNTMQTLSDCPSTRSSKDDKINSSDKNSYALPRN